MGGLLELVLVLVLLLMLLALAQTVDDRSRLSVEVGLRRWMDQWVDYNQCIDRGEIEGSAISGPSPVGA